MSDNAITVEGVNKTFGELEALKDINLTAAQGKVLGLLGPNGAGKTTLVRIMTPLLQPDSGRVMVGDLDVLKDAIRLRQIIGLAGQYPAVDELLTGYENLVMVGQLYHFSRADAKARAHELLERFTLKDAANRVVKTYSGGMRRRLDLAASIVSEPSVLFLDEPTTGLDPRTRLDLWDFIKELVSDGTTLLLTTQYLEEADYLADRIAVMDSGQIIAEGTATQLKQRFAKAFLSLHVRPSDFSRAHELLKPFAADTIQTNPDEGALEIPVDDGSQSLMRALRTLDDAQINVEDISLRQPTLDDVFLSITGKGTDDLIQKQKPA